MKIAVAGLGYVGTANAVLLAQHHEVIAVDLSADRVERLNSKISPVADAEISDFLKDRSLNLTATTDALSAYKDADYVLIATPTDYDPITMQFDTSSVESVIEQVIGINTSACIVIKSTVPVGFTANLCQKTNQVIFSPEFLREGKALYDCLYPSRIVVGEKSERAEIFAKMLREAAAAEDVTVLLTSSHEAEAIKLFSNSYLAMRVAFFNELDSFALARNLNSAEIITGVGLDPRIGQHYNNPSFGYGGYCLPKDTKQLLANYDSIPQTIIGAIVDANETRQEFIANAIIEKQPKTVGVYRLAMKAHSDNYRQSAVLEVMQKLHNAGIELVLFEPAIQVDNFKNAIIINDLFDFKKRSDLVICNRHAPELADISHKIFTRDVFKSDM